MLYVIIDYFVWYINRKLNLLHHSYLACYVNMILKHLNLIIEIELKRVSRKQSVILLIPSFYLADSADREHKEVQMIFIMENS